MKFAYAAVAALLFAVAAPAFAAAPTGPVQIPNKQGQITFDHSKHAKLDCTKCHADAKGGKIALDKTKGHELCLGCHKAETAAKAPTKCNECHKGPKA